MEQDPSLRLVELIQKGIEPEESFRQLFLLHWRRVQSFFVRRGFSREESDDLTQEVFFRVFKAIARFRRESRFEKWLWEIAANILKNELRRRKADKRDGMEQPLELKDDPDALFKGASLPSSEPTPLEIVVEQEQVTAFRIALENLPPQMRLCCILRFERELKYHEIASVMKISIETVKAHLHQARKRLGAALDSNSLKSPEG